MTNTNNLEITVHEPKEQPRFSLLGVEFVYLALLGIAVAMIGWIAENTAKAVLDGVIDARFHRLPFISPYALIVFALHLLLGHPDRLAFFGKPLFGQMPEKKRKLYSNFTAYAIICATVFLGELVVGNVWDIFFDVQLWDYSSMPLHVTQYTGAVSSFGFGTGAFLIFKYIYIPALAFVRNKVDYKVAKWICATLGVAIVLDTLYLMLNIICNGSAPMLWEIVL